MTDMGITMRFNEKNGQFEYGEDCYGPKGEQRRLKDIAHILKKRVDQGPDVLYTIAMDVGQKKDKDKMLERNLLFGVVFYTKGLIDDELIRSQGHKHAISASCNASTCELYEIWEGEAYVYMQDPNSNMCYAVYAKKGDQVIVPPNWIHATMNASANKTMMFGAWCVRDFGFDYTEIKEKHGIAFYPRIANEKVVWENNPYEKQKILKVVEATPLTSFNIEPNIPIYTQFQLNPDRFMFVSNPKIEQTQWEEYKL